MRAILGFAGVCGFLVLSCQERPATSPPAASTETASGANQGQANPGAAASTATAGSGAGSQLNAPPPSSPSGAVTVSGDAPGVDLINPANNLPEQVSITGTYQYSAPVRAKLLTIQNATIKCTPGQPLRFEAVRIEWSGTVSFQCAGHTGADGSNGTTWHNRGWCVGQDQGNWENNFRNGGNEAGDNGTNGESGTDGSAITIQAATEHFANATIVNIDTHGGKGGQGGKGGEGRQKCHAPSGADCDHGTRLSGCLRAPNGVDGAQGSDGSNGAVNITGDAEGVADLRVNR